MCPDISILSAFYDGELEGRADGAISEHLRSCGHCKAVVESYGSVSRSLLLVVEPQAITTEVDALRHIYARAAFAPAEPLWRRSLKVPAPFVLAAAALIVVLSLGLILNGQRTGGATAITRGNAQASTLEDIIDYLESRNQPQPVTLKLPENTFLRVVSEATLVRAAEYQRIRE